MKNFLLIFLLVLTACGQIQGPPGPQGVPGPTGSPGSQIQMIKLCPGVNSYPSVFVEYAFCVDNILYATYSANNGFTTMLTPGVYQSNAIGSQCSFAVVQGCEISN